MAEVSVATRRPIRSSFDLWSGVPASEIVGSATTCDGIKQQRHSLQVDPQISLQLSCGSGLSDGSSFSQGELMPEAAELLMLMQAQQQLADGDDAPSADEIGIDAQIQRLMQLKQFLRRSKQQQQQQVILEDIALASQSVNGMDNTTSALFTSSALTTPLQSESLLNGSTAEMHNSWANLSSARAAAQPSRRSVDLGGLAQQLAALELRQNAAAAALADSQGLGDLANMRSSMSFTNGMNNRLSIDCGLAEMNENLVAAAAMAAQAEASRRTSLCLPTPQMSGLLECMILDNMAAAAAQLGAGMPPMQAHDAGTALAMQSALYAPAAPALDTPVVTAGLAGMGGMTAPMQLPSPAAGRHSLDCSLLGLAPGVMGLTSPGPSHPSGMPSPVTSHASLNLNQSPLLADRGYALAQAQAQSEAAGWGFTSRRGRASCDVRRQSSDLLRSSTPDQRQPPRKSVSLITPSASTCSSAASSSSSGRSSPRGRQQQQAARRTSLDKPPTCQPPKWSPPGPPASPAPRSTQTAATDPAAARKGTGVFIPSCLIKS